MNIDERDDITITLLHYFVTELDYEPLVVHGVKDEMWLQNVNQPYAIIRIVKSYIHNDEQLKFDYFKSLKVMRKMRAKTLTWNLKILNIYLDLGESVRPEASKHIDSVNLSTRDSIKTNKFLKEHYPGIAKSINKDKKEIIDFIDKTNDINRKTEARNAKLDKIFNRKEPMITYGLIAINVLIFLMMAMTTTMDVNRIFAQFGNSLAGFMAGEYYRLFTAAFLHSNILHIAFNGYALYILGTAVENYFGKKKMLAIYFLSVLTASLLSLVFLPSPISVSVGASGGVFGLFGAYIYFAYKYRVYMAGAIRQQILPILMINFALSLMPGIDMAGHVGGLAGGALAAYAIGTSEDKGNIHGIIMLGGLIIFMIAMLIS